MSLRRVIWGIVGAFVLVLAGLYFLGTANHVPTAAERLIGPVDKVNTITVSQVYCPFRFTFPAAWVVRDERFFPPNDPKGASVVFDPESVHNSLTQDPSEGYFLKYEELCMQELRGSTPTRDGKRATVLMGFCAKREDRAPTYTFVGLVREQNATNFLRFTSADRAQLELLDDFLRRAMSSYEAVGGCVEKIVGEKPPPEPPLPPVDILPATSPGGPK